MIWTSLYLIVGLLSAWYYRKHIRNRPQPLYMWLILWLFWPIAVVIALIYIAKEWEI